MAGLVNVLKMLFFFLQFLLRVGSVEILEAVVLAGLGSILTGIYKMES